MDSNPCGQWCPIYVGTTNGNGFLVQKFKMINKAIGWERNYVQNPIPELTEAHLDIQTTTISIPENFCVTLTEL